MPIIGSRAASSVKGYGFTLASGPDIPSSGLQLYLDANNPASYSGSGTLWKDLSGKGRNFTWNTNPSFNSSGIKYFNSYGYSAGGPASNSFEVNNTSGYTILTTIYQYDLRNTGTFKFYCDGNYGRGIFTHATWGDGVIYWDQGGCCNADTRTNAGLSNSTGNWHVIGLRCNYSATNRTIWDNGSIITTNTSGIANINLNGTAAQLCASDEYGTGWNGRMAQFALYNRALSDSEMATVTNTFKAKVGL